MENIKHLSDLYVFQYGKGNNNPDNGGQYPVYGSNGIIGWYDKYNSEDAPVIGHIGANCGSVVWAKGKHFVTYNGIICKAKPNVNNIFAYYSLLNSHLETRTRGAAQPFVSYDLLNKVAVYAPSAEKQQKIASILSTYDNLIENNTKRIKLLEQMAENLYKEWFVRFRFPGHENVEMENGLPKEWTIERLGNLANISTGKCNREDAEDNGIYPLFDRSQEIKKSSQWLKDCEAIIVPGEGTSFMPRYFRGKFNLHQRCYCVNPQMDDIGFFLFYTLMLNRKYFLSVATGATVPSLRQNNFTKMKFIMPPLDLIRSFNKIVEENRQCCDNLQKQNILLTKQRDLLLPRLMSGKLEVKP